LLLLFFFFLDNFLSILKTLIEQFGFLLKFRKIRLNYSSQGGKSIMFSFFRRSSNTTASSQQVQSAKEVIPDADSDNENGE
jgi:hypothetical protein